MEQECMDNWLNWTTVAANIATALGISAFAIYYFSHRQNQRQFGFTVMISCIERFQQLMPQFSAESGRNDILKKYVDLTNEEFFYFQNGYIPKPVMAEWMDSIIEYFPIYIGSQVLPINFEFIKYKQIHESNMIEGYPRLKTALTIRKEHDVALIFGDASNKNYREARKKLISEILRNMEISIGSRHFKKAMMI